MPDPIFMKFGVYVMEPEPISAEYFTSPAHKSLCLYLYPTLVARQMLDKNITVAKNTYVAIEELLDWSFSHHCDSESSSLSQVSTLIGS